MDNAKKTAPPQVQHIEGVPVVMKTGKVLVSAILLGFVNF